MDQTYFQPILSRFAQGVDPRTKIMISLLLIPLIETAALEEQTLPNNSCFSSGFSSADDSGTVHGKNMANMRRGRSGICV